MSMQTVYIVMIVDTEEPIVDFTCKWLGTIPGEIGKAYPLVHGEVRETRPSEQDVIDLYQCALGGDCTESGEAADVDGG